MPPRRTCAHARFNSWKVKVRQGGKVPFPEFVAKGSRFTLGVWGWRRVRSTLLLPLQPFATVCNLLQPVATACDRVAVAVPIASPAKVVLFLGDLKCRKALFDVAGVVTFQHASQSVIFCVAGATILLHRLQKRVLRGRRSILETTIVILRGMRSTSDVSCCMSLAFCEM